MQSWSYALAWLLCLATVALLAAGALVTSTGSSLAVPDWPLAYGQLFPPMVGGILYEHGHRLIAGSIGLITIVLALWLWWAEPRRWVRRLGVLSLAVVAIQALLGGITVLFLLPKAISISHALLAQGFFLLTVLLVQVTAPGWRALIGPRRRAPAGWATGLVTATFGALMLELFLGAVVRHFGAGLAIPDFPLAFGGLIPPMGSFPIAIHFLHRLGALLVLILAGWTLWEVLRRHGDEPALKRPALAMGALTALQILLGGAVIWSQRAPAVTTLHLVNGALLIAATGLLALRAWILIPPAAASLPSTLRSPVQ